MIRPNTIKAVFFDLDGTLMDSEAQTGEAITEIMEGYDLPGITLPITETRGRSWRDIAETLCTRFVPDASPEQLISSLHECWSILTQKANEIPGASNALKTASKLFKIAIVSSSPKSQIDRFLDRFEISDCVAPLYRIGAKEVKQHKPHPEGYLLAAEYHNVAPYQCLVFEDSEAGINAAKSAGMQCVAILPDPSFYQKFSSLADAIYHDFSSWGAMEWRKLAEEKTLPPSIDSPRQSDSLEQVCSS